MMATYLFGYLRRRSEPMIFLKSTWAGVAALIMAASIIYASAVGVPQILELVPSREGGVGAYTFIIPYSAAGIRPEGLSGGESPDRRGENENRPARFCCFHPPDQGQREIAAYEKEGSAT